QRHVAAEADGIEMLEEEERVATEQIAEIVPGRDAERVDAVAVEQRIQPGSVQRRRGYPPTVWIVHRRPPPEAQFPGEDSALSPPSRPRMVPRRTEATCR